MENYLANLMNEVIKDNEPINTTDKALHDIVTYYAENSDDNNAVYAFVNDDYIMLFNLNPKGEDLIVPILPVYINTSNIVLNGKKGIVFIYDRDNEAYINMEDLIDLKPKTEVFYYDSVSESFINHKPDVLY